MKNLIPIEYAAQRVLTTKQLATFYECDMQKIHQHLRRDKDRFVEGEYYFKLRHKNLREFKKSLSKELYFKYESVPALYLWTKSGCALHAEILDTDKVRKAFEELEKNYFNVSASLMENRRNNASQIVVASNVRCYLDENGTAWLNVEDVARGLGFVDVHQKKDFATSGEKYETVRWSRVNQYLQEFGYSKIVDKDDFIPENMFYRLAMKAKNEVAEKFQAKVADEVLPSIRKTGKYEVATQIKPVEIINEIGLTRDALKNVFGVKDGIALAEATNITEKFYGRDLSNLKKLIPPAEHNIGYMNSTKLAEKCGFGSAQKINELLAKKGLQVKEGNCWRLTNAGKKYGEMMPFAKNGHSGYQIMWNDEVVTFVQLTLENDFLN